MKNKKLIGLASLMLVLGATGCPKPEVVEPCKKHTWGETEVVKAATCTEAGKGKHTCTVCNVEEETTIKATGHDYKDDEAGKVDPTCTQEGSKTQTCSRCGDKKTVKINALGHAWVDDEEGGTPATCTEPGTKNQTCSRCQAKNEGVEVPPLNHDWGEYATVEGKEPTCEGAGEEKRVCARCNAEETRPMDPIGHKPILQPGSVDPEEGKAAVRVYKCDNCGETSFGFKASEVSAESRDHLNFTQPDENGEVGASFWGRPIGNSLALDANGTSVNQQNNECVYCSTETGDFFEYVFDLTEDQARELATCRCYCDAQPADWLSGDFWAYNANNTDWTPGYYIDGSDEHVEKDGENYVMVKDHSRCSRDSASAGDELETEVKMGKRITDYRYILYVDGNPVDFDKNISVPVVNGGGQNQARREYVMPYTFNLHAGTNRISLRMAGGYRSTFYNFIFRPYVAPTAITVDQAELTIDEGATAAITGAMEGVTYTSDKPEVATVDANGVVTGVAAGTAKITVAKEGNYAPAVVNVTVNSLAHVHAFGNPVTVDAVEGTSVAYTKETCECGAVKITMSAVDMDGIITAEASKLPKGSSGNYDGTKIARYVFNSDVALDGAFYADGGVDNDGNYGLNFHTGKVSGRAGALSDGKTNTVFTINDNPIAVTEDPYNKLVDLNGTLSASNVNDTSKVRHGLIKIGDATINAGANKFTMAATDSYGIVYLKVVFIGVPHEHAFGEAETLAAEGTNAVVKKSVCACGAVKYEIEAKTGNFALASGSAWKNDSSDPTKDASNGFFKLKSDGHSFTFTFALPKGFVGKMYQRGFMDSYNANKTKKLYYQTNSHSNIEVKVNDGEAIDMSQFATTTFQNVFGDELSGSNSLTKDVLIGDVELGTTNTISYKRVETLNLSVSTFVFIGTEVNA